MILAFSCCKHQPKQEILVLILSGSNNHDWQKTSPLLKQILEDSDLFSVDITNQPDTLTYKELKEYNVILNNWNSWPENDIRWSSMLEEAILKFIKQGGGFVTFHASTSVFYHWSEFKNISTAAWIMDTTWHGKNSSTEVLITNHEHPVTKGLQDFYIFDELWVDAEKNSSFTILGKAKNTDILEKGQENQPAIFVKNYKKGRIFHTILGHDLRAIRNSGFKQILLRGTEWAATGEVNQSVVQELQKVEETNKFNWKESDTTFALYNNNQVIWQYNFNNSRGRPFFHPVFVGRNNITCLSPDDHPWHLGQWFCWKYINKVNYWEYQNNTFQSEGVTEIKDIEIKKNQDFSAEINLYIVYHPLNGENVLEENRQIKIATPDTDNKIKMEYQFEFTPTLEEVELNRTPILEQENGTSWGGYAGLSIRFNQDFSDSDFITGWGDNDSINGKSGNWLYMGLAGIDGKRVGTQIIIHPSTLREGSAWYSVNTEEEPFYYFSPAFLYYKPLILKKGEKLLLNYRVVHWPGQADSEMLEEEYQNYMNQ